MTEEHRITVERGTRRVTVTRDARVLADSSRPLLLHETGYPVRYYLPPEDVRTDLLAPSDTHTWCPYKGTASYWSLPDSPDLAWYYPDPVQEVAEIRDHVCFLAVDAEGPEEPAAS
ncbi:hypothetical protein DSC45_17415 [Streptomyces sp. YIM 130001]|uniref:DUF427 domain-containing protein n=1 Tax=Streptomyces sp. YIM 130001 TaxID=2259644 RepID=UPI000E653233|nr:DUF427 domain-containing protein [Streptomyces sp. YIM 130001]RII15610.1 hypothetical protein DSC45_17415 [Streptomyces sp. YIM 130001]